MHNFYTAEYPSTTLRRLTEALELMGAKITSKDTYTLKAMVPVDLTQVEVGVGVYTDKEDEGVTIVCVSRKQGDPLGFQKAFKTLKVRSQTHT
jgi:hypothetical protein